MASTAPRGLGRTLAANAFLAAPGRVASILLWLVLAPPIRAALHDDGFAVWSLFFGLTGWLGAADLGLAPGALRHVAAARATGDHARAGAFASLAALGYVALGALWLVLLPVLRGPVLDFMRVPDAVRPGADVAFVAGAVVFAFTGLTATLIAVLQACGRFDLGNATALSLTLAQAAALGFVLVRGADVTGVVLATGAGGVVATLVGALLLAANVRDFRWASPRAAWGQLGDTLRFGAPMQLANVLAVTHQQLDKVLLARFRGFPLIAAYELGLRIVTAAGTVPQLLLLPVTPAAAAIRERGGNEVLHVLHVRSSRYILVASAAVTAGLVASATRLLAAWLGAAESGTVLALRGLAIASYAGLACGAAPAIARALMRTDLEAEFSGVALAVHLALGLVFVPRWGLPAALAALVAGNAIGAAWFLARLAAVAGWARARTVLEPIFVPTLALLAGFSVGRSLDGALPGAFGAAAWPGALLVGAVAAGVTVTSTLVVRYLSWAEARELLRVPGS